MIHSEIVQYVVHSPMAIGALESDTQSNHEFSQGLLRFGSRQLIIVTPIHCDILGVARMLCSELCVNCLLCADPSNQQWAAAGSRLQVRTNELAVVPQLWSVAAQGFVLSNRGNFPLTGTLPENKVATQRLEISGQLWEFDHCLDHPVAILGHKLEGLLNPVQRVPMGDPPRGIDLALGHRVQHRFETVPLSPDQL